MKKILVGLIFVHTGAVHLFAQSDVAGSVTGHVRVNSYYVGWDNTGTSGTLEIRNDFNQPINFSTNGNQRATVNAVGNVGIGTAFNPTYRLDVDGGDIHIDDANNGYMIDDHYVLWHNARTQNIFVGVAAGNSTTTGDENTFVGNTAGLANTTGDNNTFIGRTAGTANTTGFENTFLGQQAGSNNTTGAHNTMLGASARGSTAGSSYRTAVGAYAYSECDDCLVLGAVAGENFAPNNTNVGIGTTTPLHPLHIFSSATPTTSFTATLINNTATSSTNSITKIGLSVQSTGTWNGTSSDNIGLRVNVSGGTVNYAALFTGGNVGMALLLLLKPLM